MDSTLAAPLATDPLASSPHRWVGTYRLRMAADRADLERAFRLRYLVFNLELNEGLARAHRTGLDEDPFDAVCDHLLVEHAVTGQVVGTYRMQTGFSAARNLGYYSAREFDFSPYERFRHELVELGRACIHRDHRSFEVLTLLWRGIAYYAMAHRTRLLVGCSSVTSQDPAEGAALYHALRDYQVDSELRTRPLPDFTIPLELGDVRSPRPPKLLRAYLSLGAQICGAPAIDREFGTIDFLTLLDLHKLVPSARARFMEG